MKVLQINAIYEKYSTGRTTKELHEALTEKGIDSYVAASHLYSLKDNCYKIGDKTDYKIHALLSRLTGKQGYFSKKSTNGLISYIDKIKPDVIHLRNLHGNYINLPILFKYISDNNIPVVITLHDCWFYTGKCMYYTKYNCNKYLIECGNCPALHDGNNSFVFDFSKKMLKDKEKWFNSIDKLAVIAVSKWVNVDAKKSILKNAKINKYIYNWIDLETFKPMDNQELRKELSLENKFIIFGIAQKWIVEKGLNIFNELANILPDNYQIVLAGNVPKEEDKNLKIKYLGGITDIEYLSKLYSMADVFVNPSIQETFGKTTAEAMSCGTPVIAYNSTATPELIGTDNKCGYLVDENKASIYKEKIIEISKNNKDIYIENTRKRAEKLFSKDKNINEYIEIYRELIKKK